MGNTAQDTPGGGATGTVRVSTASGKVRVYAEQRDDVSVEGNATITAPSAANGNTTTVESTNNSLIIYVPTGTNIVVGATSGRVEVHGHVGTVAITSESGRVVVDSAQSADIRADAGRVRIADVASRCRVRTTSGSITVQRCGGAADVATRSGRIEVHQCDGPVRAHCVSGRVDIEMTSAQDVEAETVNGRIDVSMPSGVRTFEPASSAAVQDTPEGFDCCVTARSVSGRVNVACR